MRRALLALVLLAVWTLATILPTLSQASGPVSLTTLVSTEVQWGFLTAPIVLASAILVLRWDRLGLHWPARTRSFALGWPYLGCVLVIVIVSSFSGLPPLEALGLTAFNTFFVGVSEELMFRGFLLRGFLARLSFWAAIWLSSLLFGAVHLLNGLITGDSMAAAVQAGAAFLSALFFVAIRLRTASLYPGILIHWAWDFAVITLSLSMKPAVAPVTTLGSHTTGLALLVAIPFGGYGLLLLRKGRAVCPEWSSSGANNCTPAVRDIRASKVPARAKDQPWIS